MISLMSLKPNFGIDTCVKVEVATQMKAFSLYILIKQDTDKECSLYWLHHGEINVPLVAQNASLVFKNEDLFDKLHWKY